MTVAFRLLGDVSVAVDGRDIEIGHARQRCVLAVLLVEVNRSVSIDQIVERVWADEVPQRGRAALYSYMSRLRRALAAAPGAAITRQASGYVLRADPATVDLHEFHRLVARARATEDDMAALAMFDRALGLWRGEAFAALDSPWFTTIRQALERDALQAELDRNDLALGVGQHARLVGDLGVSATTHPLNERLAGQLMLALYRCDRPADALERYQQIRRVLAEELGADPGPALRTLHQQILRADPALTIAAGPMPPRAAAPPHPTAAAPRQLPPAARLFTGRLREIAALDAVGGTPSDQPGGVTIVVVSGTAGIGKTTLAVHWAHRLAERFPDGQLYIDLRGFGPGGPPLNPGPVVRAFLQAFDVPPQRIPSDTTAQAGLYRSLVAGRRVLVVLDNARDVDQVRPLLPGARGCLVIVTSRNHLAGLVAAEGAYPLNLDLLPPAQARHLLTRHLGADRVDAEPGAVDRIVAVCAGLPLALTVVAARAATHPRLPLSAMAEELAASGARLDALHGGDVSTDVRAVFAGSYRLLDASTARLFRLLGLHPGPDIAAPAVASLAALPIDRARTLLAELTDARLVEEHQPGRFTVHDLLRAYAVELTGIHDPAAERHAAVHRVLDHYLHTAHATARRLDPYREPLRLAPPGPGTAPAVPADALTWFSAEYRILLAAIDHAASAGFDTHAWQLAWSIATFLDRRGLWHEWAAAQQTAVAAAARLARPDDRALAHRGLGLAYTRLGRFADARDHHVRALDLYRVAGDTIGQAHAHRNLSWVDERRGHHRTALDHATHSYDLYRSAGDRIGEAAALSGIGWAHAQLAEYDQALPFCERAANLQQERGDLEGQANTLDGLGYVHLHLGDQPRAVARYRQSVELWRQIGDRSCEAAVLNHLGDAHLTAGEVEPTRAAWREALTILDELGHSDADRVRSKLDSLPTDECHPDAAGLTTPTGGHPE